MLRIIQTSSFLLGAFSGLLLQAATWPAASADRSDVASAISSASDGDIVTIPAGTGTGWTTTLTITKAITLQGDGIGSTIIQDAITDSSALISWSLVANKVSRMTGIEFENNGRGSTAFNGVITVAAGGYDARRMRIDNCRFENLDGVSVFTRDVIGVIDNNQFTNSSSKIFVYIYHEEWGGFTSSDGSWADPPDLGSENFLFIEDNTMDFTATYYAFTDAYRGARYVARYNTCLNGWWEAHGTDSGSRRRGTRAMEIYSNSHDYDIGGADVIVANFRSATGVVYDNTYTNYGSTPTIPLAAYRMRATFAPFGYADGNSRWDDNDDGNNPYVTGTATSGGALTMTDTSKSWTPDEWIGYSLVNLTTGRSSYINDNTSDTITFDDAGGFSPGNMAFSTSDSYEINLVNEVMDQPGKGGGTQLLSQQITSQSHSAGTVTCTLTDHGYSTNDWVGISETESDGVTLNGTFQITVNSTSEFEYSVSGSSTVSFAGFVTEIPAGWPDQDDEPIYEWNNTQGVSDVDFAINNATIRSGEHYVSDSGAKPGYTAYTYPHPLRPQSLTLRKSRATQAKGALLTF